MQSLNELDLTLTQMFDNFNTLAHSLQFEAICELSDEAAVELQKYPGLYKIDIFNLGNHCTFSEWFAWFKSEWVQEAYEKKHTPNPKKNTRAFRYMDSALHREVSPHFRSRVGTHQSEARAANNRNEDQRAKKHGRAAISLEHN